VLTIVRAFAWIVLVGAPLLLGISYVREALLVDSCLDSGGVFDYRTMICDREAGHDFISYGQRHGVLFAGVVLATSGAAVYLISNRYKARAD
jgi:hypothetical protein